MNESTKTKKALRGSLFALFLCIVLLIGTTFAWFTDTASTGVNKIQSGTLDVELQYKNNDTWTNAENKTLEFKKAVAGEEVLWEPGCTYELPELRVVNKGNLALKYKVQITGELRGDEKLNEAIDWTIGDVAIGNEQKLAPNGTNEFTIKGHMKEEAGNEYQDLSIDGISITVVATQDTVESDSIDNTYDKNATYPVASANELKEALANKGGIISVTKELKTNNSEDTTDARIIISQPTTLNLDAKIISPDNMGYNSTNFNALIVAADTTINATKDGGIDTGTNGGYGINVMSGASLDNQWWILLRRRYCGSGTERYSDDQWWDLCM